jgi:hypothetical protein
MRYLVKCSLPCTSVLNMLVVMWYINLFPALLISRRIRCNTYKMIEQIYHWKFMIILDILMSSQPIITDVFSCKMIKKKPFKLKGFSLWLKVFTVMFQLFISEYWYCKVKFRDLFLFSLSASLEFVTYLSICDLLHLLLSSSLELW